MMMLLLSVMASAGLVLLFKVFERYNIDVFQAIVFNYITAAAVGVCLTGVGIYFDATQPHIYMYWAAFQGCLYISLFVIIGITAQNMGVSVASVASKMALVMPVMVGVFLYNEKLNSIKIIGLLLGLVAVLLCSIQKNDEKTPKTTQKTDRLWVYPLIIFVGSGVADSIVGYAQKKILLPHQSAAYSTLVFATAAVAGSVGLAYLMVRGRQAFGIKNLVGGVVLGIVNYFSLYCFIQALAHSTMGSAATFAINNVGVVLVAAVAAYIIFNEKLSKINLLGIGVAIVAIALTAL